MSDNIKKFEFENTPKKIEYLGGAPLELNENFVFYHNKSKVRKELTPLQYLFKSFTKNPLQAFGIRDSFLDEELTEKYLIVLFTTSEIVKNTNKIISSYNSIEINQGCFYLETNSDYMLLLTRDLEGLRKGSAFIKEILTQVLEDYFDQEKFDKFIKIPQFKIENC
ncbi:MAG: hypothetical protein ACFFD7_02680 [Candidatus Thorarchaeota archaeon]